MLLDGIEDPSAVVRLYATEISLDILRKADLEHAYIFAYALAKRNQRARLRLGDLAMRLLARDALALDGPDAEHVRGWLHAMSITIAAGTSQIQRNIVAERILGMPKEPKGATA